MNIFVRSSSPNLNTSLQLCFIPAALILRPCWSAYLPFCSMTNWPLWRCTTLTWLGLGSLWRFLERMLGLEYFVLSLHNCGIQDQVRTAPRQKMFVALFKLQYNYKSFLQVFGNFGYDQMFQMPDTHPSFIVLLIVRYRKHPGNDLGDDHANGGHRPAIFFTSF